MLPEFCVLNNLSTNQMGIRLAAAMGNTVTAISTSPRKKEAALKIGAKNFVVSKDEEQMKAAARSLDLILNTVSANHQESVTIFLTVYVPNQFTEKSWF